MPLFPPGAPVTIVLDGRPLVAYAPAYLEDGRVFAPARPVLTRLADRVWIDGNALVVQRGNRRVRVPIAAEAAGTLDGLYVALAPVLRQIGVQSHYESAGRRFVVRSTPLPVAYPTPYNPTIPAVAPRAVFTAEPVPTPRPIWSGTPLPRRTALPLAPPAD